MSMTLTGPWRSVVASAEKLGAGTFGKAVDDAIRHEAMVMLANVGEVFKNQGGHRPWTKLSPVTLALRKHAGFGGSKMLQVSNSLRRSVTARRSTAVQGWFVGVHRSARGPKGKKMVNIAAVHEGPFPTLIPVTPKMRKFWMAMFLQGAVKSPMNSKSQIIVIMPRPFLAPAFEKTKQGSQQRMVRRVKAYLKAHGVKM